jgi:hypothetical protein
MNINTWYAWYILDQIYVYVYVYVCVSQSLNIYICVYVCVCVCITINIYIYLYICVCVQAKAECQEAMCKLEEHNEALTTENKDVSEGVCVCVSV